MAAVTSIEWTDRTWNCVRGCARVSPGCEHCYAERVAHRFSREVKGKPGPYAGLTVLSKKGPRWSGTARFVPEALSEPLGWRKPQRIFVNSMSDLFHDDVTNEQIAAVFGVMAACPQHTFQILTKRPERMLAWFRWIERCAKQLPGLIGERIPEGCSPETSVCVMEATAALLPEDAPAQGKRARAARFNQACSRTAWPLLNVWIGVSCEDQQRADERIPRLLECPAAVHFVSAEPLLGPIDFAGSGWFDYNSYWHDSLAWIIVGGESGPGARPCRRSWIRRIVAQCRAAGVAVFVKQLGAYVIDRNDAGFDGDEGDWPDDTATRDEDRSLRHQGAPVRVLLRDRKGGDMSEWPEALRVREFPAQQQAERASAEGMRG
jgi:protein gp37